MGFGNLASICAKTPLPFCSVVKSSKHLVTSNNTLVNNIKLSGLKIGVLPECYARSIDIANTVIFEIGNAFVNIGALFVLLIILYNIKLKFTAIGRMEYSYFFQLCISLIIFTMIVDCGVSPPGSGSYPYLVAVQIGIASACCWSLLVMGFLGFRLWEDGTTKSMVLVYGASLIGFALNFIISIATFKNWIEQDNMMTTNTLGLTIVMYVINAAALLVYVVCQVVVSIVVIKNLWVTGSIFLGLFFFVAGQVLTYAFSLTICTGVNHYLDGLFFGSVCNLFALMMVYKTWDMTTDDDLEFSVNSDGDVVYTYDYKI